MANPLLKVENESEQNKILKTKKVLNLFSSKKKLGF